MSVNKGKLDRITAQISGFITLLKFIQFDPVVSVFYEELKSSKTRYNFSSRLSGTLYSGLPAGFSIGSMASYRGKRLTLTGKSEATYNLEYIFLVKRFPKIGLTLYAGYQDLMKSDTKEYNYTEQYTQYNYSKFNTKGVMFRLYYYFSFGKKVKMENVSTAFESDKK